MPEKSMAHSLVRGGDRTKITERSGSGLIFYGPAGCFGLACESKDYQAGSFFSSQKKEKELMTCPEQKFRLQEKERILL